MADRTRRGLLVHEWLSIGFVATGVFLLERLPVTYPRTALFLAYATPVLIIGTIAVVAMAIRQRTNSTAGFSWRGELTTLFRSLAVILVVFPVAFLLKSFIYLINPRVWDRQLIQLDNILHLGFSPTLFLTTLFGEPIVLRAFDLFYTALYYFIFVIYTALFLAILPLQLRMRFAAAFAMLWMFGTSLYLLLPSWGPAFYATHMVEEALRWMPRTVSVQAALYEELSSLVQRPLAPRVVRFGCVAAFPSLHVGVMALFALVSRHVAAPWFRINILFIVLMVVGSVITGYHYAIDGYAGIALASGVWWLAKRSVPEPSEKPGADLEPA